MLDNIRDESIKAIPAAGGTALSLYAKINQLDWAVIVAQATVGYILLQAAYLLWKWHKEVNKP